jgi:hypothetical protein
MKLILLFASQPLYGAVLPGLTPPLHPFQAALLYHAMLRDQARACLAVTGATVRVCFAPGLLPGSLEGELQWEAQRGASLPDRLGYASSSAFKSGATAVLALGYEPRFHDESSLTAAFGALEEAGLAFGEGLSGFSRSLPSLLAAEPDGYARQAQALGLGFRTLEGGLAFENFGDLRRALRENPASAPLSAYALAAMA